MNKLEAINAFTKAFDGHKPTSVIDLNKNYYIFSLNDLSYSFDKNTGKIGCYNPMMDYDNFNKALRAGRYETL